MGRGSPIGSGLPAATVRVDGFLGNKTKQNKKKRKNGRDEMGKSANVCIWVEEKKMEEEMRESWSV